MKYYLFFLSLFFLILLGWSATTASSLPGKWEMVKVIQDSIDVTSDHNPEKDRWISFDRKGVFLSGGQPYGPNEGNYTFNASSGELYLDSQMDGDDSQWMVRIDDDKMRWQGVGTEWHEKFFIYFRKVKGD